MTYATRNGALYWKRRRLLQLESGRDVQILDDVRFARAADGVWMCGKLLVVDPASFELLSPAFAKDRERVFEILETKLKPVPKADAKSFRPVGEAHGVDAAKAWWRGKALRRAALPRLRELDRHHACDGDRVFHTKDPLNLIYPEELDLAQVDLIAARETNAVNLSELILRDGQRAILFSPRRYDDGEGGLRGQDLDSKRIDALRFLHPQYPAWVSDGERLFWQGRRVCDLGGLEPEILSSTAVRVGDRAFVGDRAAPGGLDAASLVRVADTLFAGASGLWEITGHFDRPSCEFKPAATRLAPSQALTGPPHEYLKRFLRRACDLVFRVRDRLPYEGHWPDHFRCAGEVVDPPPSCFDQNPLQVACDDGVATLTYGEVMVSGGVADWYRLCGALWAALTGSDVVYRPYPHAHHMMSDGLYVQQRILGGDALLAMQAAEALVQLGAAADAEHLAIQVGFRPGRRSGDHALELGPSADAWAAISPSLLAYRSAPHATAAISATTYLAGARRLLDSGLLDAEDVLARYDALALVHGLVCGTQKDVRFLREVVPVLRERADTEAVGFLRDYALCAIDLACRPSVFDADWLEHARGTLEYLIERRINTDVNRARLAGHSSV